MITPLLVMCACQPSQAYAPQESWSNPRRYKYKFLLENGSGQHTATSATCQTDRSNPLRPAADHQAFQANTAVEGRGRDEVARRALDP